MQLFQLFVTSNATLLNNGEMLMKINPKVAIALVLIVAALFVTVNTIRARTYSGANLAFEVGSGSVTLTNSSDAPVLVQLLGTGSATFVVTSATEGVAGSSIKQTSSPTSQLFEFGLPPGDTTFTVAKGKNLKFSTTDATRLQATVQPISSDDVRSTILLGVAVIAGALFYLSNTTQHRLVRKWIGREIPVPLVPVVAAAASNIGNDGRAYSNYGSKD
jgi:hypothetical protein